MFNRADVLERCVRSAQAQSYRDIEIILADDGSTDGSGKLCFDLASRDSRIKVSRIVHKGASAARNAGLMLATGEYVCFLDSDDVISPEMLEKLHGDVLRYGADMASCRFRIEGPQDRIFIPTSEETSVLSPHDAFEKMLINEGLCGYGVSPGTKLIRRDLLMKPYHILFPEDITFGEDTVWMTEVLARANRVVMDRSVMMRYSYECSNSICRNAGAAVRLRHTKWKLNYLRGHGYSGDVISLMEEEESSLTLKLILGW